MRGEAILWAVVVGAMVIYTIGLWIPAARLERWRNRLRRLMGRSDG